MNMTTMEIAKQFIEQMGYQTRVDDDGDLYFTYQMKVIYLIADSEEVEYPLVTLLCPNIDDITEGEEAIILTACNKVNRELKMVKLFEDKNMEHVSALCETFCMDEANIKIFIQKSLYLFGIIRSYYYKAKRELKE